MTDDISKVVREMRDWIANRNDAQPVTLKRWADRLESATTPAEVDKVSELILSEYFADKRNGVGDYWARDMAKEAHEKIVATLARQLAEATDRRDCWERLWNKADARADAQEERAEQAESQLAEATRRLGEVEGLVGKWRNEANQWGELGCHDGAAMLTKCADELEQLTKEPTT